MEPRSGREVVFADGAAMPRDRAEHLIARLDSAEADAQILRIALDRAYSLLNDVSRQQGVLPKALVTDIRKMLPARFPASFGFKPIG